MKHSVELSNGQRVVLKETQSGLTIGQCDCDDDEEGAEYPWWICKITTDGVLVYPNSADAPEMLTRGLRDE